MNNIFVFLLFDIVILCECVCCYIEEGVVIENYVVDCEIILCLFNEVLVMEIVCSLCYKCYYYMVKGLVLVSVVVEFMEYVYEEEMYVECFVEWISQFGGDFDFLFDSFVVCSYVQYVEGNGLFDMIKEDLIVECIVIESYWEIVQYIGIFDLMMWCFFEEVFVVEEEYVDELQSFIQQFGVFVVIN